jgi:DNA-binding CsgD family transcriptional regulator
MAREARELARVTGVDEPRADYLLGTALSVVDAPGAEDHLEAAISGARRAGDRQTEFVAANNLVSFHESAGTPARGREVAIEMAARARASGLASWERSFEAMRANLDFHAGAYPEVLVATERLLGEAVDARTHDMLVELQCLALVDIGRVDEAVRRLDAAQEDAVPDYRGRQQLRWVAAEAALWGGHPARALEVATAYVEGGPASDPNLALGRVTRSWACVDLGRPPGPPAAPQDRPFLRAVPEEMAALQLLHEAGFAGAAERFAAASALWAPWHRRGELRCEWARGEALRRSGDAAGAAVVLNAVEARVEALGMVPLLMRIHQSLRAAGHRRSAPRSVRPGGLTGREHQVLELVAEGLTNAEIAARLGTTRRTVVAQVTSACAKLGAGTRAQAAAMATAVHV